MKRIGKSEYDFFHFEYCGRWSIPNRIFPPTKVQRAPYIIHHHSIHYSLHIHTLFATILTIFPYIIPLHSIPVLTVLPPHSTQLHSAYCSTADFAGELLLSSLLIIRTLFVLYSYFIRTLVAFYSYRTRTVLVLYSYLFPALFTSREKGI